MTFFARITGWLAQFILHRKWWIIAVAVLLTAASIICAGNIIFRTQLKDMLPESNPMVQSYNRVTDLFASSSIILTFEGADRQTMIRAAGETKRFLEQDTELTPYIDTIQLEVPGDFIGRWGLYMQEAKEIRRSRELFSQLNLLPVITALNDNLENSYTGDSADEEILTHEDERDMAVLMANMGRGMTLLTRYLKNPDSAQVEKQAEQLAEIFTIGDRYTFDSEGKMLLMTIIPSFSISDYDRLLSMMPVFRKTFAEIERRHPEVSIRYTGEITREFDEQAALGFDLMVPSLVALGLILILFLFSFRQFRAVLLALITLVVGIIWDVGIIGITIRELNILTTSFAVILIGLGIDFGIHVISNYTDLRGEGETEADALKLTFSKSGSSIILGGITTAIAFFVLMISNSKAISQFGFIAGTGIITCLLSTLLLLPALLLVFGSKGEAANRRYILNYAFLGTLGKWASRRRFFVLAAAALVTLVLALQIPNNRVEYDINKLSVDDSPNARTERRIQELFNLSTQASMVTVSSVEDARRLAGELKDENLVSRVSSVADFIPSPAESTRRLEQIALFRQSPPRYAQNFRFDDDSLDELEYQIQRLEWNMIEIGDLSVTALGEDNLILKKRTSMIREIFGAEVGKPGKEVFQNLITALEADREGSIRLLDRFDAPFAASMENLVLPMMQVDRPMRPADIPASYSRELVSDDGNYFLVSILPTDAVKNEAEFISFNERMKRLNPEITGTVQLGMEWTAEMIRESKNAAVYVLIAILVLVVLTFRRPLPTLITVGFPLLSLAWLFGIFPLAGIRLNLMSVMVLPMIIGMGIDYAIHIVHRYLLEGDIAATMTYTGKGVLLSGITTAVGFGSLALMGTMGAVSSFGSVLFAGVGICILLAIVLVPAITGFMHLPKSKSKTEYKEK